MEQALLGEKASFELSVFHLLILLKLLYFRPSGTFDVIDDDDISNFFADILPKNKTQVYSLQNIKDMLIKYKEKCTKKHL